MSKEELQNQIKFLFDAWCTEKEKESIDKVRYSGPVLGKEEYSSMLDAIFNDWWSGGKFTQETENKLANISNRNFGTLTNSGSSANLLLMSAAKELYFKDGDKILTLACGFPTTVNPIIQNRLKPVFVDIDMDTLNLNPEVLKEAIKKEKISGIFVAHTLGFKSDIDNILDIARNNDIKVFFDSCDAYSTKYKGRPIQAYGKASSFSFYVAHHVTMGEGGGIVTDDEDMQLAMKGYRNWGRYCSSANCCVRSSNQNLFCPMTKLTRDSGLPDDYIVNYQYEWLGYNLKPLELQSAILYKQLDRLEEFDVIRRRNYNMLYSYFNKLDKNIKIWSVDEEVSPFGFPILLPENSKFKRKHLINHLIKDKIETRVLFGGNLMKHPAYYKNSNLWESFGTFDNSNAILERFLMLGVSQVNSEIHINKIIESLDKFFKRW